MVKATLTAARQKRATAGPRGCSSPSSTETVRTACTSTSWRPTSMWAMWSSEGRSSARSGHPRRRECICTMTSRRRSSTSIAPEIAFRSDRCTTGRAAVEGRRVRSVARPIGPDCRGALESRRRLGEPVGPWVSRPLASSDRLWLDWGQQTVGPFVIRLEADISLSGGPLEYRGDDLLIVLGRRFSLRRDNGCRVIETIGPLELNNVRLGPAQGGCAAVFSTRLVTVVGNGIHPSQLDAGGGATFVSS